MADTPRPGSIASRLHATSTVLVIEDEHDIADFLRAYFRASGYALVHVDPDSVDDVVAAVEKVDPACVLLDLHLRGFSGLDAYRLLRDSASHAKVPVIVVTADARASVRDDALEGGVDAFVSKPFSVKSLAALVADRIARAEMRAATSADASSPVTADAVTGLATYGYVQDRIADEIRLARHTESAVVLALVKVCSLGEVNTSAGYAAGDFVLRAVGERLRGTLPPTAVVGRNAGDEFAVVLPGNSVSDAEVLVEAALESAARPVELPGGGGVPVVLAAGVAVHPNHAGTRDELYMAADTALVDACDRGRRLTVAI